MIPFAYHRANAPEAAIKALDASTTKFLGGGTNLIDLMKYGVENPTALVDINHIGLDQIRPDAGGMRVGALVRNSDLANHPGIVANYPLLSHALLSGASVQLRNRATTGGNLMQRTRCYYFMDTAFPACNKRKPGSGCAALQGFNRIHAVLGQTDEGASSPHTCIATNPSDMNVALYALNAQVEIQGPSGRRSVPVRDFHRLPAGKPDVDTVLQAGELILGVSLPSSSFSKHSWYLKARDRQSYAFALVSVAAGLDLDGGRIRSAGLALGGLAHKPWWSAEAESELTGKPANTASFERAAKAALSGAKGYEHNAFKIELAKQCIVRALTIASKGANHDAS